MYEPAHSPLPNPARLKPVPKELFSATPDSQLLFDMRGMTDDTMSEFNSLRDARGNRNWTSCVDLVAHEGIDPVFMRCKSETMESNLFCIRESMAEVLAWMYRERLLVNTDTKDVDALCERMKRADPLGWQLPRLCEKVVKDFLFASFSGMTASRPWDGSEQANGGYIVVRPNGKVLCYHASDRERFRDYLLHNTFIEYVSCKKYHWGYVEKDSCGRYVLPLNAAVRFRKVASEFAAREHDGA